MPGNIDFLQLSFYKAIYLLDKVVCIHVLMSWLKFKYNKSIKIIFFYRSLVNFVEKEHFIFTIDTIMYTIK